MLVVMIDLLTLLLGLGAGSDAQLSSLAFSLDQVGNVLIFGYVGYRTGRRTGRVTASAEGGLTACILPALVATGITLLATPGGEPPTTEVLRTVALNIALGGVSALLSGWWTIRARSGGGR